MFPLQSAYKIPLGESFIISDEISDRDRIIDALLDKIHNKYIHLAKENEELKKKNNELLHEINYVRFDTNNVTPYNPNKYIPSQYNPLHNDPSHNDLNQNNYNQSNQIKGPIKRNITQNNDNEDYDEYDEILQLSNTGSNIGSKTKTRPKTKPKVRREEADYYILATESTRKGYELCNTFQNYKFRSDEPSDGIVNIYDKILQKMRINVKPRKMPGAHVHPNTTYPQNNILYHIPTKNALDGEFVENIWHDYNPFKLNKKYMLSLVNTITEYVSDNVYVEKVLERLNEIIDKMNNDIVLMKKIFDGIGILKDGEKGRLGLLFKGGNVYKLYTHILNNRLDHDIFQTYFTDVERFFKKSDCDFGLIIIITDANNKDRFEHLERTKSNVDIISTIQYMILNEFRNNVLDGTNPYDYVAICGKNDRVITSKLSTIMRNMLDVIFVGRLEFEKTVLRILLDMVDFGNAKNNLKDFLTYTNDFSNRGKRLLDVLEETDGIQNIRNVTRMYNVENGKFLDWFKICLSYAMRDKTIMSETLKKGEFKNFSPVPLFLERFQRISTDTMEWRDVRTIYDVVDISNIIIGDSSYPNMSLKRNIKNDDEIYGHINSNKHKYKETTSQIVARRMERLGRIHSNRNDFFVEMGKTHPSKDRKFAEYQVINDIMFTSNIAYENAKNELATPFYISINKKIGGKTENAASERGINSLVHNIHRYSKYGFVGHDYDDPTNDDTKILFENIKNFCKIDGDEQKGYLATPPNNVSEFSLGRLMVSSCIIFITKDNLFVPVPLSAEYIDLSYSYKGDNKATSYEYIDGFIKINGKEETLLLDTIAKEFYRLADHVESNEFQIPQDIIDSGIDKDIYIKKLANSIRSFDECAITKNDDLEFMLIEKVGKILKYPEIQRNLGGLNQLNQNINLVSHSVGRLAKLSKYFTIYGYGIADKRIVRDNIMFPKLSTFIVDLYMILFVDTRYPWGDNKYMKRLNRFVYFVLFSRLRYTTFKNLEKLLNDIGIYISEYEQLKDMINSRDYNTNYISFARAADILEERSQNEGKLQDNTNIFYDNDNLISICSIDHFMYNFHLLDFMSLHYDPKQHNKNPFRRCQFVLKRPIGRSDDCHEYIIISFNKDEITNMDDDKKQKINDIIRKINVNNNEDIILPFDEKTKRYVIVSDDSNDPHIKSMYNYFRNIESLRERIIITLYNYLYVSIKTINGEKEIINPDPLHIMLNLYDGDIDRILAVI